MPKNIDYYTWGTWQYEHLQKKLVDSCKKFDLTLNVLPDSKIEVPKPVTTNKWLDNMLTKSITQMVMVLAHRDNDRLVWIDSDCEFLKYPEIFHTMPDDIDLALHEYTDEKSKRNGRSHSLAVVYVKVSDKTKELFRLLQGFHREKIQEGISEDGEIVFSNLLFLDKAYHSPLKVLALPEEYYGVEHNQEKYGDKIVIKINDSRHLHHFGQL